MSPVHHVVVEADGGSRGNPGPAGYGAVVFDAASRAVLAERSESIGVATNNVAEYQGLLAGLGAAAELAARRVDVRMDSKLVVEQMSGRWGIKHDSMRALAGQAKELIANFAEVSFEWIPRASNSHADRLANEAMDRAAGIAPKSSRAAVSTPTSTGWTPPAGAPCRLILVRHGSTEHSAKMRFSGRNDLPLNEVGAKQAVGLAARSFGDVTAVISSPLRRAVQTAEAIAAPIGRAVEVDDDLVETDFGQWEGLTFAEAAASHGAELARWRSSPDVAPPGGESFATVGRRVRRGRDRIVAEHLGETVVVVSHVTPIKLLVRFALEAPPSAMFRLHLDTASVSIIDCFGDGAASVRLVNDTGHLS